MKLDKIPIVPTNKMLEQMMEYVIKDIEGRKMNKIENILRNPPYRKGIKEWHIIARTDKEAMTDPHDYEAWAQRIKEAVLEAMPGQVVNVPNLEYGKGYTDAVAEMRRKVGEL